MKKFNQEKIERILKLYTEYNSLREVCKQLNISISSAHKYVSQENISNKHNIIDRMNSSDERLIGLYVGLWMGDGTQYYDKGYTIKICSDKRNVLLNRFIQEIISRLFGKKSTLIKVSSTNQAYIKFKSQFIFDIVYEYVKHDRNKTHSVGLKENINFYSDKFLEGCLLGLALSDGSLQYKFNFNVTSIALSNNMIDILKKIGFNPVKYIYRREKYGWKDLQMIHLTVSESQKLELFLDEILKKSDCRCSFKALKYEK